MTFEFPTAYGKAIIEKDVLYLRSFYLPVSKSGIGKVAYALTWILIFVLQFLSPDEPKKYVGIVLWGLMLLFHLPEIYDRLFKRSYSSRIPLHNIASYSVHDDYLGYRTIVRLTFKSGRYRKIIFRKLEQQAELFTEKVAEYIHSPELA